MARTAERILDELLVLKCQHGDEAALETLVARWHGRLRQRAVLLVGDDDAGGDVAQDAWVQIVRTIRRLNDPAAFPSWAYRIVGNKAADWVRRRTRRRKHWSAVVQQAAHLNDHRGSSAAETVEHCIIRRAIDALPVATRRLVTLYYLDGRSTREIAAALDVPIGTVKSRLFHAREKLKRQIERNET